MLTVLPGTLPRAELARRLADTDSAAVMKLGRTFDTVRGAVDRRRPRRRCLRRARDDGRAAHRRRWPTSTPTSVPYFSIALLPSAVADPRAAASAPTASRRRRRGRRRRHSARPAATG